MAKIFSCFLLIVISLLGAEELKPLPLSNTDGGLPTLVHGCVSVITGDYMETETDLVMMGPDPLVFQRTYCSSDHLTLLLYRGWRHNHHSLIEVLDSREEEIRTRYFEKSGRATLFSGRNPRKNPVASLNLDDKVKGYTNLGSGIVGGRTHVKNTTIDYHGKKNNYFEVTDGSGTKSFYDYLSYNPDNHYDLVKEVQGSGNILHYDYLWSSVGSTLYGVKMTDKSEKKVFSSFRFSDDPREDNSFTISASDGRKVLYKLHCWSQKKREVSYSIKEVIRSDAPKQKYEYVEYKYEDKMLTPSVHVSKKILPNNRFLCIDYFQTNDREFIEDDDIRLNRVKTLSAPVGTDATPIPIYHFRYEVRKVDGELLDGSTSVRDAYNHLTKYYYDQEHRLEKIKKYSGEQIYSTEKYKWSAGGNLLHHSIQDSGGEVKAARDFSYDSSGNIIRDAFYGKLKGISTENDHWITEYSYTKDGRNLLLEQREPNGKTIQYRYHPNSDLLARKYIIENGTIRIRYFYEYDANAVLIQTIVDDGNTRENAPGWSERKITRITPRKEIPIGLPEIVEEFYVDPQTKQEVLLSRVKSTYSVLGHLLQEEHFDSQGKHQYTLSWEYDEHGNMTLERNPLGDTIERKYDENDNLIFERGYRKDSYRNYEYDNANRLTKIEECHDNGLVLTTSHTYDYLGNLTSKTDPFGQKTEYTYDAFGRQTQTRYPNETTTKQEYDLFGNVTHFTDQLGHVTQKISNVRGQPLKITYPDNTTEYFEYNADGTLAQTIAKNELKTKYTHDCFGRLLKKELYSKEQLISTTSSTYNSFHKTSETDANGNVTHYSYDPAGRLKTISKGHTKTEYEYDTWGRLSKTKEWTGKKSYRSKAIVYDALNRVLEERIEDETLLQYGYDQDNNRIFVKSGPSTTRTEYTSHKQPAKIIDPNGHEIYYTYNYQAKNKQGQTVLEITETDQLGTQTITQMNIFGKPEIISKRNPFGKILSKKKLYYDPVGNLNKTIEDVIVNNKTIDSIETHWEYNATHQPLSLTEAVGTPEQKKTHFTYNKYGEKESIIKPDGTQIKHEYDACGRLKTLKSETIHYRYTYDNNNNLISVEDKKLKRTTLRSYNTQDQMVSETLATGSTLHYDYDFIGRPLSLTLPDNTSITYKYNSLHLQKVERRKDKKSYTYEYLKYDQAGHILEAKLPGEAGTISYDYDPAGHIKQIKSPTLTETLTYDDVGNLTSTKLNTLESTFTYDGLYQLSSEKGLVSHTYLHDSLYNCLKKDKQEQKVNALNQLLKNKEHEFSYDLNGNRIKSNNTIYTYDELDRLTSVAIGTEKYIYTYDCFNRRLEKKHYSNNKLLKTISYLYVGQNEIGTFEEDQIKELRILGLGLGAEIGATIAMEIENNTYIPLHDHNGNITTLLNLDGSILETYRYSAFGQEQLYDTDNNTLQKALSPWRFASKRLDEETGFVNFGRRCYDPQTARWTSPDPIGFDGGPNLYAYVKNSPLCHIDLYGLYDVDSIPERRNVVRDGINAIGNFFRNAVQSFKETFSSPVKLSSLDAKFAYELKQQNIQYYGNNRPKIYEFVGRPEAPNLTYVYINGINTSFRKAMQTADKISKMVGGLNVHFLYNPTQGIVRDLNRSFDELFNFAETPAVTLARSHIESSLMHSDKHRVVLIGHSEGTIISRNAMVTMKPEHRERVGVISLATAGFLSKSFAFDVRHFISDHDFVYRFDRDGLNFCHDCVQFLKKHPESNWWDHDVDSKTLEIRFRLALNYYKKIWGNE